MDDLPPEIRIDDLLAHADRIRKLARSLVFDPDQVDDVVQQTWRVALERRPQRIRNSTGWLGAVVANTVRHLRRSERRHHRSRNRAEREDTVPSACELVERAELQQELVAMVLALQEPYRSTVLRRFFEGQSAAEIARSQGLPAGTVRSRLKRSRDQVREQLDDRSHGDRQTWSLNLIPLAISIEASKAAKEGGILSTIAAGGLALVKIPSTAILGGIVVAGVTRWAVWPDSEDSSDRIPVAVMSPSARPEQEIARVPGANPHKNAPVPAKPEDVSDFLVGGSPVVSEGGANPSATKQASRGSEEWSVLTVKTVLMLEFLEHMQWTGPAFQEDQPPMVIAVLGDDPFGTILDDAVRAKNLSSGEDRELVVLRWPTLAVASDDAHLVFMHPNDTLRVDAVLDRFASGPSLLLGDQPGFCEAGVALNLILEDNKVRFEVHERALANAGITMAPKLSKLAARTIPDARVP